MSAISIFYGLYCNEGPVIQKVAERTGFRIVRDELLATHAAKLSGIPQERIARAFSAKAPIFNAFTHEKEKAMAYLRLAMAETLHQEKILLAGCCGQLISARITHVLRACLIADMAFRIQVAARENVSEKEAQKNIRKSDEDRSAWTLMLKKEVDPWEPALYDILIPMGKVSVDQAVELIVSNIHKDVLTPTETSRAAVADFLLQARVEVALASEGHDVDVEVHDGVVALIINKHVLMLSRLEEELKALVSPMEGVRSVETRIGPNFHQADIYRKYDFQTPAKVLLVDDEREFVQTLSERLLLRDMGSAVAYDGESALKLVSEEEPEVMILDLKMPGIDGIEVLKRVKSSRPNIEVIILTGHGSEADKETCMNLGAFAYLQKPVDIDVLSDTLKRANEKIHRASSRKSP
jgi:CheY-like chemotaxis protein/cytidylate kinase